MPEIRPANLCEMAALTDLSIRSKAHWGYDDAFMAACREELTFTTRDLETSDVAVAVEGGTLLGVAQVSVEGEEADLEKFFVDPPAMGRGIGRLLFDWTVEAARIAGAKRMLIEADPQATPFYRRMGARDIGTVPSASIPGRNLPQLVFSLSD